MSDTLILTLTNDYLFKLLLGSEENKVCLQDFLEELQLLQLCLHSLTQERILQRTMKKKIL